MSFLAQIFEKRVLKRFIMHKSKFVGTPLNQHMKLSVTQAPTFDEGEKEMKFIPCDNGREHHI